MTRPSTLIIDTQALVHNVKRVRSYAPNQQIIAMIKANAYGCGINVVAPVLAPLVDIFGVACLEEAQRLREYCPNKPCLLFQGLFKQEELALASDLDLSLVIHHGPQLDWLLAHPLPKPIKIWVKVDTGMHRLGFEPQALSEVTQRLQACPWIDPGMGLMTHLACADEPGHPLIAKQLALWDKLQAELGAQYLFHSIANSASIIGLAVTHVGVIRPGLMLYGVSPFANQRAADFGLKPVMHFNSALMAIHQYAAGESIGYGATWTCARTSIIGVIPVGYGDGYPRQIKANTPVWIAGRQVPIVGRVSMDMMTVDLTDCPPLDIGEPVELWGCHIPIEEIAKQAQTIGYELMCQVSQRVIRHVI